MYIVNLILFALLWLGILYLVNAAIAREWKRIDAKTAVVYFLAVGMIGVCGEIFLDTVYNYFVGTPLWHYNILPIHHGYTSAYAPIVWGIYGFHIYLLHDSLGKRWAIHQARYLALIISFEALILEAALTLSAKPILGDLMYYYTPGDLWHISSFQNIPFYFICGVIIIKSMRRFKLDPLFFSILCASLTLVVVAFT